MSVRQDKKPTLLSICEDAQLLSAALKYKDGVSCMQRGLLEEAILRFSEASFFSPSNANPLVAQAECYAYLCDLQSAARQYRRAMWLLMKRHDRKRPPSTCPRERYEESTMVLYAPVTDGASALSPALDGTEGPVNAVGHPVPLTAPYSTTHGSGIAHVASSDGTSAGVGSIAIPTGVNPSEGTCGSGSEDQSATVASFGDDSGVELEAVRQRLAGLLDALGLFLFKMSNYAQALRYAEESLELCPLHPVVSLHKCVYLIALLRNEEAEFQLEAHMQQHPDCRRQTAALLIQLYCNRQAFRPARMLLEEYASDLRHEPSLTVARHIFHDRYDRYRRKATENSDLGTVSRCIEVFPNDAELLFFRAQLLIAQGKHVNSVKDLFRCIKETNGSHKAAVETMTAVLFKMGSTLDGDTCMEDAITYYSESLKWNTTNTLVLLARGDCYVRVEDYEKALQDYRRVLQLDPEDKVANSRIAFLHDLWGRKLYGLGRLKDAEKEFTNAIKTNDREPLFFYHRALCRFGMNEHRFGLRDVLSCQRLQPADPSTRAFIVRYLGTNEEPSTTAVNKAAGKTSGVLACSITKQFAVASKRAAALYGRPLARQHTREAEEEGLVVAPITSPLCMSSNEDGIEKHGSRMNERSGVPLSRCQGVPKRIALHGKSTTLHTRDGPPDLPKVSASTTRDSIRDSTLMVGTPRLPAVCEQMSLLVHAEEVDGSTDDNSTNWKDRSGSKASTATFHTYRPSVSRCSGGLSSKQTFSSGHSSKTMALKTSTGVRHSGP